MKLWKRAMMAGALAVAAASAVAAQSGGYAGLQFVNAVRAGDNAKALELLNATPAIIDARDGKGETALYAAIVERNFEWARYLLQRGANPELGARDGDTPLMAAARLGFFEGTQWLLGRGAKVDATNRRGETALIVAVQNRKSPIVRMLMEAGADPDHTDSAAGLSARDYAKRDNRSRDILRIIETPRAAAQPAP